jgi:Arylsulfotransferase (ASST)
MVVTGTDVASYPAYDPGIERYAVTTTDASGGTLTVHASTTDPAGVVRVDGRVAPGGVATVTGLSGGDEVSVFIEDSAAVEVHTLVYLPAGFPALEVVTSSAGVAPGQVGLTLNSVIGAGPRFVTTVDRHGVPSHVRVATDAYDLKDQPDGSITYSEPTTTPGRTGMAVVELDPQWHEVARHETVGLVNTDLHDSILEPDGTSWLMAYQADEVHGQIHSVIQELDGLGQPVFQWSSDGLQDESVVPAPSDGSLWDYAHMNSMQVLADGDVVASFRHLSAVLRIATVAHDGFQPGDIVWRLGGRDRSFDFVDDPYDGPCAQHTASVLPNGHVLVFDDGSGGISDSMCVDSAHPDGPFVDRTQSRVAEYALDPLAGTATLVWSYAPPSWYTWFMGSAARLTNGNTLAGWAAETRALATEVSPAGDLLWQLRLADPAPSPPPISYRASLMQARDAEPPVVDAISLPEGQTFSVSQQVTVDFRCTDGGGSSLQSCAGDVRPGGSLNTATPGLHTVHLTASDGAGHTTTATRSYTVTASYQPKWRDDRVRGVLRGQRVSTRLVLVNGGTYADAFALHGPGGDSGLRVSYRLGGADVTRAVRRGRLRTGVLPPGGSMSLRVVVARTDQTRPGDHRKLKVRATSLADVSRHDSVRLVVTAPG